MFWLTLWPRSTEVRSSTSLNISRNNKKLAELAQLLISTPSLLGGQKVSSKVQMQAEDEDERLQLQSWCWWSPLLEECLTVPGQFLVSHTRDWFCSVFSTFQDLMSRSSIHTSTRRGDTATLPLVQVGLWMLLLWTLQDRLLSMCL